MHPHSTTHAPQARKVRWGRATAPALRDLIRRFVARCLRRAILVPAALVTLPLYGVVSVFAQAPLA